MRKNKSTWIWIAVVAVLLVGLFLYPRLTAPKNSGQFSSKLPCLLPNLPQVQHLHPYLQITVDGEEEIIPANIGLTPCHRPLHTHETDGIIHVEAQDTKDHTLGQFFTIWEKSFERAGFSLEVTVDENLISDPQNLVLKEGQKIMMKYTKLTKN